MHTFTTTILTVGTEHMLRIVVVFHILVVKTTRNIIIIIVYLISNIETRPYDLYYEKQDATHLSHGLLPSGASRYKSNER